MPSAWCSKLSLKYIVPIRWKLVNCADGNLIHEYRRRTKKESRLAGLVTYVEVGRPECVFWLPGDVFCSTWNSPWSNTGTCGTKQSWVRTMVASAVELEKRVGIWEPQVAKRWEHAVCLACWVPRCLCAQHHGLSSRSGQGWFPN